jgi:hypothetical protein
LLFPSIQGERGGDNRMVRGRAELPENRLSLGNDYCVLHAKRGDFSGAFD